MSQECSAKDQRLKENVKDVDRPSQETTRPLVVLAVLAVIAALYLLKAILIPVALALVVSCMLSPVASLLRRHFPFGPLGAFALLSLSVIGGLYLASLMAESLVAATYTLPSDIERTGGPGERANYRPDSRSASPACVLAGARHN